jgi:hypothetical protein
VPALTLSTVGLHSDGSYQLRVSNEIGTSLSRTARVVVFRREDTIGQVLNLDGLTWRAEESSWFPTLDETFDGDGSMQSGAIGHGGLSELGVEVDGPATIAYQWKVSSELNFDLLRLYVDDLLISQISGEVNWQQHLVEIPEGSHTLHWQYEKDKTGAAGGDAGWIDVLSIVPGSREYNGHLETTGLPWFSSGNALWEPDRPGLLSRSFVTSPPLLDNQESIIGFVWDEPEPAVVFFNWGVSSEFGFDFFNLLLDSRLVNQLSGDLFWRKGYVYLSPGSHLLQWLYNKDGLEASGLDVALLDLVDVRPYTDISGELNEALDTEGFDLVAYGAGGWNLQSAMTVDGEDALESGLTEDNDESILEAALDGPCVLSFQWQVSSEEGFDTLTVTVDGSIFDLISGQQSWAEYEIPLPSGTHTVRWVFSRDPAEGDGANKGWLDQLQCRKVDAEYSEAVEFGETTWDIGGQAVWASQDSITKDGEDALRSGVLFDGELSIMSIEVEGPGTLSYWWKVSSEENADFLDLIVNDVIRASITGETDWTEVQYSVGPGVHVIDWAYTKDFDTSEGLDAGFVDTIQFDTGRDPLETWRRVWFAAEQQGDDSVSGLDADPDEDGVVNFLEYAHLLDPMDSSNVGFPEAVTFQQDGETLLTIAYRSNPNDPKLVYTLEQSMDLIDWKTVPEGDFIEKSEPVLDGSLFVTVMLQEAINRGENQFYRVVVSR